MSRGQSEQRALGDLVFLGLNKRVIALDRYDGSVVWEWRAPKGSGLVTLLLDGDRLIVSVNGYMYCLDPVYGQLVWENHLSGYGSGFTTLASASGAAGAAASSSAAAAQQAAAAASGAAAATAAGAT